MKQFIYYRLVDKENYCNHTSEKRAIQKNIEQKKQTVIYAPRNYGKTSLIRNIIIPEYKKKNKNSFIFFADFLEVKDMPLLIHRLQNSFEHSFSNSFPVKNLIENTKKYFKMIRPEITIDPITSLPNLSLKLSPGSKQYTIEFIFSLINDISKNVPTILIIDEFQVIVNIDGAQAIFRNVFEAMSNIPIVLMGSKKHILTNIFSNPDAPLAFWGEDIEFQPISFDEYYDYINERFMMHGLSISFDDAKYLQNMMMRIPEPINIVCQQIVENFSDTEISRDEINISIKKVIESKESRYERYISNFSSSEERVAIQIAKIDEVEKPQSKDFIAKCKLSHRSVKKIFEKFMDQGVIEKHKNKYKLSDPLFNYYLKVFR